ncbi:MAG: hypothetical protein AB7T49_06410 [Oligoflexales bacterium]
MEFQPQQEILPGSLVKVFFVLYVLAGTIGITLISDQWDEARLAWFAFFVLPATCVSLYIFYNFKKNIFKNKKIAWAVAVLLLVSYGWGNLLLINACSDKEDVVVSQTIESQVFDVAYHRGGLGWLFRYRF